VSASLEGGPSPLKEGGKEGGGTFQFARERDVLSHLSPEWGEEKRGKNAEIHERKGREKGTMLTNWLP